MINLFLFLVGSLFVSANIDEVIARGSAGYFTFGCLLIVGSFLDKYNEENNDDK